MTKKRSLLMIGSYGCGNRGDDAILAAIARAFGECKIYATCGNYEDIGRTIPVHTIPCRLNEGFSLRVLISMLVSCVRLLARLCVSDALFFGGGSTIHDLTPYNLPFMFLWHRLAKLLGKKVVYVCVGIGPLNTAAGKRAVKRVLATADGVYVRDTRSIALCKTCDVLQSKLVCDAAFAGFDEPEIETVLAELSLKKKEYIVVTGCAWFQSSNFWKREQMDFSEQIRQYAEDLQAIYQYYQKPLLFLPTVFHDETLYWELRPFLNGIPFKLLSASHSYAEMDGVIQSSFLLIGVRMHSIIFAVRHAVPFAAILYDQKVAELLQLTGLEDYGVDIADASPVALTEICERIETQRPHIEEKMQVTTALFQHRLAAAFEEIRSICHFYA